MSDKIIVRNKQVNPYFHVHHDLFSEKRNLSVYAIIVFVVLCKIDNQQRCAKGPQQPKNRAYIAKLARISTGSVSNAIAELITEGLIAVDEESAAHPNRPTEYTILDFGQQIPPSPYDGSPSPHDHDDTPPSPHDRHTVTGNEISIRKEENTSPQDEPAEYEVPCLTLVAGPSVKTDKHGIPTGRRIWFKNVLVTEWELKNGKKYPWDAKDEKALTKFLIDWKATDINDCAKWVDNWLQSEDANHSTRWYMILPVLNKWMNGAHNQYGRIKCS